MGDDYFNERTVNRQLLMWAIACRRQLDRWEPFVAAFVRSQLNGPPFGDALIWEAQIEHHFLLIAARNLIRAIDMTDGAIPIEPTIRAELIEGRDLIEHWSENLPVFLVRPRSREPRYPSGKSFAERNPEATPYWWLGWSSADGPQVLPNVSAHALHELVDRVEEAVLARDPGFRRFMSVRQASPWLGEEAGRDRWWPRPKDAETP